MKNITDRSNIARRSHNFLSKIFRRR
jgi:hypothetical protein